MFSSFGACFKESVVMSNAKNGLKKRSREKEGRRVAKRMGKFGNNTTELEYYFGVYFK